MGSVKNEKWGHEKWGQTNGVRPHKMQIFVFLFIYFAPPVGISPVTRAVEVVDIFTPSGRKISD